jgi:hypothetical protein
MKTKLLDCFNTVAGFRDKLQVRLVGQKTGDPLPKNWVVVDGQHADSIGSIAHKLAPP